MQIEILKEYESYKNEGSRATYKHYHKPRGLTAQQITDLENEMNGGKPFPKVLKEFLFIGGEYNGISLNSGDDYTAQIKYFNEKMAKNGRSISRPYFIFQSLDGGCFTFIYLDEDSEDPQVWNASATPDYDTDEGEQMWKSIYKTLSGYVAEALYNAKKGLNW